MNDIKTDKPATITPSVPHPLSHAGSFRVGKLIFTATPDKMREEDLVKETSVWLQTFEEGKLWVLELQFLRATQSLRKEDARSLWRKAMSVWFDGV